MELSRGRKFCKLRTQLNEQTVDRSLALHRRAVLREYWQGQVTHNLYTPGQLYCVVQVRYRVCSPALVTSGPVLLPAVCGKG